MGEGDRDPQSQEYSRIRFCTYCGREFHSDKALGGHLRIHSQHQAKSKAGIHHMKSRKLARKHSSSYDNDDDQDASFSCFVCDDSFSSMKLLCQHMRNHREKDSNGIQQPIPSQESHSLIEPDTIVHEGIDALSPIRNDEKNLVSSIGLLKDIPNWFETGKRKRQKIVSDKNDSKIYNPMPLRVYYGSAVPLTERTIEHSQSQGSNQSKKHKTEEGTISMESESIAADSESTIELLLGNNKETTTTNDMSMMPQGSESRISDNEFKSSSSHGRVKNSKRAMAVKSSLHQCEICGKTFQMGQALGGHKTSHRMKPVVDPLVQRKPKKQRSGETTGQVRDYVTIMLFPLELRGEGEAKYSTQEYYQQHPKKQLDFDLNIPYQGQE